MIYGKTIVITGVSSGIGARTAELAAAAGADVIGVDINEPQLPIGRFHQADLSDPASVSALIDGLPDRIDALCNVAGLSGQVGAVPTLAVNFYGLRTLSQGLAPKMREGGSVVNVASIAGFGWRQNLDRAKAMVAVNGYPDVAAVVAENGVANEEGYPVSKELLLLWTLTAAHDPLFKARGIRVNAVSPGPVETPILTQFREVLGDERVDSDISRVGRAGNPADIAPVVLFLCSDAARWINGSNLAADGGLEASVLAEVMDF
jgi:NAD(P)-dependent dehydrogenase (short-subunit alcohol dehydrogenase family)